jgi:hypothetical protein
MRSRLFLLSLAGFAAGLAGAATTASSPAIAYTKSFPGSVPAYVSVHLQRDGKAVYQEAVNDEEPVHFKLPEEAVAEIFALAGKLDYFKRPLEANLKVANMGMKTLRYENGADRNEVKFNYSLEEPARLIVDWFDRITETQQLHFNMERSVKFDRLGVNNSLLQFETALDRQRIVGPDRFLPLLDRIAKNDSYLHMARERAAALADAIRHPKPKTGVE